MCFHYSLTKKEKLIRQMINAEWDSSFEPVYHTIGFSHPVMPVLTNHNPGIIQQYNWGLIPHWVQTKEVADKIKTQTLNAKAETLFEKPSFKPYVQNRCIILADGFFEWMEHKKKKYPHYIYLNEFELFGFAGLFTHWTDKETGELLRTFTIITTEANTLMATIHNTKKRMPVVLSKPKWNSWLQPSLRNEQIANLLKPCDDEELKTHTISKLITSRERDSNVSEITKYHHYPELDALAE